MTALSYQGILIFLGIEVCQSWTKLGTSSRTYTCSLKIRSSVVDRRMALCLSHQAKNTTSSGANMPTATKAALVPNLESFEALAGGMLTWTAVYTQRTSVMTQLLSIEKVPRPCGSALRTPLC